MDGEINWMNLQNKPYTDPAYSLASASLVSLVVSPPPPFHLARIHIVSMGCLHKCNETGVYQYNQFSTVLSGFGKVFSWKVSKSLNLARARYPGIKGFRSATLTSVQIILFWPCPPQPQLQHGPITGLVCVCVCLGLVKAHPAVGWSGVCSSSTCH